MDCNPIDPSLSQLTRRSLVLAGASSYALAVSGADTTPSTTAPLQSSQPPSSDTNRMNFTNPILSGMYPDPSICRRGEDYFLVTSSFEYFPALPVFHSRDLVNWVQIGHGIDRVEQMPIDTLQPSGQNGTYAPTIRYHDGWFYLVCTIVRGIEKSGNFVVKTQDPFKGWSEPIWIAGTEGIDPSLFFEDGKVYLTAARHRPKAGVDWHTEVYLQELNAKTFQPISEPIFLTDGAVHNATAAEAAHIYERNGFYYLLVAEGGTAHNHAVTIFRASAIEGPYKVGAVNPILTHRHLGKDFPIVGTGHADFVETQNGEFWMVCLAMRPYGGYHYNLGRETFLMPMVWEDGWPIVSKGHGQVLSQYPRPNLPASQPAAPPAQDFGSKLGLEWNFLRSPTQTWWSLTERPGSLSMRLLPAKLSEPENLAFIARRQQHMSFSAQVVMECAATGTECAGMALFYSDDFHFRWVYTGGRLELIERRAGQETIVATSPALTSPATSPITLGIQATGQDYSFTYSQGNRPAQTLATVDGRMLSAATAGGFVGTYIGLYVSSQGQKSEKKAYFRSFRYAKA
jgi:xylan 1,4-beta-xylosidase